jgi:hypothetical protein
MTFARSLSLRLLLPLTAVALLAACGEEDAPAPKQTVKREAKRQQEPAAAPAPVAQETHVVMPEDTGVQPPKDGFSAYDVGQAALEQWCREKQFDCAEFGRKDMIQEGDHWVTQYFGAPNGQGMYVSVRIYQDGRAEVVR